MRAVVGRAAVFIGLGQEEIPARIQRIHFKFEVFVAVAVRVDEQLLIVVAENNRVVLNQRGPDTRLLQFGGDVEIIAVPLHLGAALNVDKVQCPRRIPPLVIDPAVDANRLLRSRAKKPEEAAGIIELLIFYNFFTTCERPLSQIPIIYPHGTDDDVLR